MFYNSGSGFDLLTSAFKNFYVGHENNENKIIKLLLP